MSTMNLQSFLSMESEVVLTDEAVQQAQDDSQELEEEIRRDVETVGDLVEARASAEDMKKESFKLSKRNRELFQMYIKVTNIQLTIATTLVSRAMTTLPMIALKIANHALAKREQGSSGKATTGTDLVPA